MLFFVLQIVQIHRGKTVRPALKHSEPAFAEEPFKLGKDPVEDLAVFRNHPK